MDGSEPSDLPQRGCEPAGAGLRAGRATLRENRPGAPRRPPGPAPGGPGGGGGGGGPPGGGRFNNPPP
ncbi:hypothetical protein EJ647_09560, partial [Pseudomonas aeruginosa]